MPGYLAQQSYRIRFGWGPEAAAAFAGDTVMAVVIDVLSFTTAVDVATSRGASVYPYRPRDASAAEFASTHGATLAGSRTSSGPSLSPASLQDLQVGSRIILPSPNGATMARELASRYGQTVAACLRNSAAVARFAEGQAIPVAILAAGERWPNGSIRPALEDLIGAGAVLSALDKSEMSPEARAAAAVFHWAKPTLEPILRGSTSGRELVDRGFGEDVEIAARLDASKVVPVLREGAFVSLAQGPHPLS